MNNFIDNDKYIDILHNVTNLCVDICLRYDYKYLLVKRKEEPCKGVYWPVGGRVYKGEKMLDAARRKIKTELGIDYTRELAPIGYYEDTYNEHSLGVSPYSSISIVWMGHLQKSEVEKIILDNTSENYSLELRLPERFKIQTFSDFGRPYWYLNSTGAL